MTTAIDRASAENRAARIARAAYAGDRHAEVVRVLCRMTAFVLGAVFLGISVCAGFDPQRALAGCALIYLSRLR